MRAPDKNARRLRRRPGGSFRGLSETAHYSGAVREWGAQLDSGDLRDRLEGLAKLRLLEQQGRIRRKIGPLLPSYDHVHTTASYGHSAPGVYSVARMVWAAHEARAFSTLIIEHESLAHISEAKEAVRIVNRGMKKPMRLALGVEFKAPLLLENTPARQFSASLAAAYGQGEAAWVVGIGTLEGPGLAKLVKQFQTAKYERAEEQLKKLNRHFGLKPPLELKRVAGADRNITDRQLCLAIARARWPECDDKTLVKGAGAVRKLLNPGGPGYVRYARSLPSYQELIARLRILRMIPVFTAQLRGRSLAVHLPLLKSWGIAGLDVAGIEPDEPNAGKTISDIIKLAEHHNLAFFGGSDYRGAGTGWTKRAAWMSHPLIRATMTRHTWIA